MEVLSSQSISTTIDSNPDKILKWSNQDLKDAKGAIFFWWVTSPFLLCFMLAMAYKDYSPIEIIYVYLPIRIIFFESLIFLPFGPFRKFRGFTFVEKRGLNLVEKLEAENSSWGDCKSIFGYIPFATIIFVLLNLRAGLNYELLCRFYEGITKVFS